MCDYDIRKQKKQIFVFLLDANWLHAVVAGRWKNPNISAAVIYVYFHVLLSIMANILLLNEKYISYYVIKT